MLRVWIRGHNNLVPLREHVIVKQVAMGVDRFILLHNADESFFGGQDEQADVLWHGSKEECLAKLGIISEALGRLLYLESATECVIDLTEVREFNP